MTVVGDGLYQRFLKRGNNESREISGSRGTLEDETRKGRLVQRGRLAREDAHQFRPSSEGSLTTMMHTLP